MKPTEIKNRIDDYGSWLEIDVDALINNLSEIRRHTRAEVMPCIKNNAYGHGLLPIAAYLEENNVKQVLVAKTSEAIQIRDNTNLGAVNMDPLWAQEQYETVASKGITQILYTYEAAECLSKAAKKLGKNVGVFVKVDTGLRRVGVWYEQAPDLIERIAMLPGIHIEGIEHTYSESREGFTADSEDE